MRWPSRFDPCPRWRLERFLSRIVLFACVAAVGCVSPVPVQHAIEHRMLDANYGAARRLVEDAPPGVFDGPNRLLYDLERGMLLHVEGAYARSNAAFERAKRTARALEPTSLGATGLSLIANDRVLDYAGEDFERTLIHLFAALNYEQLGDRSAALVEVRQVADALKRLDLASGGERVYRDDAFARYLSAMLFEAEGDLERAFVDYKKALTAYQDYAIEYGVAVPVALVRHARAAASRLGAYAVRDLAPFLKGLGEPLSPAARGAAGDAAAAAGEIVVLHYNGLSPIKREERFVLPVPSAMRLTDSHRGRWHAHEEAELERAFSVLSDLRGVGGIPLAFPRFVRRPYTIERMRPKLAAEGAFMPAELVEDIGAIAIEDLQDRIQRVRAKAVARSVMKWAIQRSLEAHFEDRRGDEGAFLRTVMHVGGNWARAASERADVRVWSTLPDTIWMSVLEVPAGEHAVELDFLDHRGEIAHQKQLPPVKVAAGERVFVTVRTVQ